MNIKEHYSVYFMVNLVLKEFLYFKYQFFFFLEAITLYNRLKNNREENKQDQFVPRTIIIGGKAAPGNIHYPFI